MQTKCGNLIPSLEIPLYTDADHLSVLLFSLNEKNPNHQTTKKTTKEPYLVFVRASTGDLSIKNRKQGKKVTSLAYLHPSELSAVWQVLFCPFPVLHKLCQPCYS